MIWLYMLACGGTAIIEPAEVPVVVESGVMDLGPTLKPLRDDHGVPALGAAVVDSDGLLALGVYGQRRVDDSESVQPEDPWHIGSDTKAMTAMWVATYVDQGVLSWETPISSLFGPQDIDPGWQSVTLGQLLAHRGGAPAQMLLSYPLLWIDLFEAPSVEGRRRAADAILDDPPADPGSYQYHHLFGRMTVHGISGP